MDINTIRIYVSVCVILLADGLVGAVISALNFVCGDFSFNVPAFLCASFFMVFIAAWALCDYRSSNRRNITTGVGFPVIGAVAVTFTLLIDCFRLSSSFDNSDYLSESYKDYETIWMTCHLFTYTIVKILLSLTAFICLIIMFTKAVRETMMRRVPRENHNQELAEREIRLSIISDLVTRFATPEDANEDCPICQDTYAQNDKLRILPCNHEFHTECIDKWIMKSGACPICRTDITEIQFHVPKITIITEPSCDDVSPPVAHQYHENDENWFQDGTPRSVRSQRSEQSNVYSRRPENISVYSRGLENSSENERGSEISSVHSREHESSSVYARHARGLNTSVYSREPDSSSVYSRGPENDSVCPRGIEIDSTRTDDIIHSDSTSLRNEIVLDNTRVHRNDSNCSNSEQL